MSTKYRIWDDVKKEWRFFVHKSRCTDYVDSHNQDIYEGDVVTDKTTGKVFLVWFFTHTPFIGGDPLSNIDTEKLTIMGNIYNTPGLIKKYSLVNVDKIRM